MFIENKYYRWYHNLVNHALSRVTSDGIYEKHHIIPKSMGGSNDIDNLVELSCREHFIAHLLLTKITTGKNKRRMCYALNRICNSKHVKIKSSRLYQYIREQHIESIKIDAKLKLHNNNRKGKTYEEIYGEETAKKLKESRAESNSKRIWTDESKTKMSISKSKPNMKLRKPKSESHKKTLSENLYMRNKLQAVPFNWNHKEYGTFHGTVYDLIEKFPFLNMKVSELTKTINGVYKHRGWSII